MDSLDDRSALIGKISQGFHDTCGRERIKTCGWLIEENQTWVCYQLNAYRCSFSFSSGYSLDQWSSYLGVLALV